METSFLTAFITVAELGSFSQAAERLHLTQPAVTKRIQALEAQLGKPLFDRIGRRISLTEAGHILLPRARKIVQDIKECQRALGELGGSVGGELTLATSHHVGLHRLPKVLRRFSENYPQVNLELRFLSSEQAYLDVLHGRVELAVITLAPEAQAAIEAQSVWDDPLYFVASPAHPLARIKKLSLEQLAQYPAILPELNTYTSQIIKRLFDREGLALNIKLATNFLETIKMMVSIDLGWSLLPTTLIDEQLSVLKINGVELHRQLGFIHHRERTLSNAAKAFILELGAESSLDSQH